MRSALDEVHGIVLSSPTVRQPDEITMCAHESFPSLSCCMSVAEYVLVNDVITQA